MWDFASRWFEDFEVGEKEDDLFELEKNGVGMHLAFKKDDIQILKWDWNFFYFENRKILHNYDSFCLGKDLLSCFQFNLS